MNTNFSARNSLFAGGGRPMGLLALFLVLLLCPTLSQAGLYTAVGKRLQKTIMSQGLKPSKFKPTARFNRSAYLSRKPSTALAEKGKNSAVIRMRESPYLKNRKNIMDLRNPTPNKLHGLLGKNYDLRGGVKNKVIGPKAGHKIGTVAGQNGKVIEYRSVKNGGTNVAIPKKVFEQRPNIVRPEKIVSH